MKAEDCCERAPDAPRRPCPDCGRPGPRVDRITLKALLRPAALVRLGAGDYRFCGTRECSTVYYGPGEVFRLQDVLVPVFQKEAVGGRIVCYCFDITEEPILREVESSGASSTAERIRALVQAGRCACEVRNPQGSCCLGNVTALTRTHAIEERAGVR